MKGSSHRQNAMPITTLYYLPGDSCLRVNPLRRNSVGVDVYCLRDFREIYKESSIF